MSPRERLEARADLLRREIDDATTDVRVSLGQVRRGFARGEYDLALFRASVHDSSSQVEHSTFLLEQVDAALARLDAGTWGVCEGCGDPIPAERLDAFPWASRCVACGGSPRRPVRPRTSG